MTTVPDVRTESTSAALRRVEQERDQACALSVELIRVLDEVEALVEKIPGRKPIDVLREVIAQSEAERADREAAETERDRANELSDKIAAELRLVTRERDSLARRCAARFEETQRLNAELASARAERDEALAEAERLFGVADTAMRERRAADAELDLLHADRVELARQLAAAERHIDSNTALDRRTWSEIDD